MIVNLKLFIIFFRIGIFGFGGGYAMLPLIFQSVQNFGVMSYDEFSNLVALSQVTPGPIAVNVATYVGFYDSGAAGALIATLGVATPSFILVLTAMFFLKKFKESKWVQGILSGARPAAVGLIAASSVFIAQTSLVNGPLSELVLNIRGYFNLLPCAIFICTLALLWKFKINPILIMVAMGAIGALLCG